MLISYFLTDNPSWDNPSTIKNHIDIIPSCTWGSQFDHLKEPKAICRAKIRNQSADFNSLDLQGIIYPHEVTSNLSKTDLGFLSQQEEIMLGPSSAEESLVSQFLPLPLMTCSYEEALQVIRNPEPAKGDHQFSSKRKRKDYSDRRFWSKGHNSEPSGIGYEPSGQALAQVKEMIYRAAASRPVNVGVEEVIERPKRKNVRISDEPQTVAARHRRERISEKLRVLQRLVPGGSRMDTASMLDEAANYIKFLKAQVIALEGISSLKSGGGVNGVCSFFDPIQVTNSSHYCLFFT